MSVALDTIFEADMKSEDHMDNLTDDMSIIDLFCTDEQLKEGDKEMEDDLV